MRSQRFQTDAILLLLFTRPVAALCDSSEACSVLTLSFLSAGSMLLLVARWMENQAYTTSNGSVVDTVASIGLALAWGVGLAVTARSDLVWVPFAFTLIAAAHGFHARGMHVPSSSGVGDSTSSSGSGAASAVGASAGARRPTEPQGRGPNYRRGPNRTRLVPATYDGATLRLYGRVFTRDGDLVSDGSLVVWGTSPIEYDFSSAMTGYGVVPIQADGTFSFVTALPRDAARPAHLHVAVEYDGGERLVTQLYFAHGSGIPRSLVVRPTPTGASSFSVELDFTTP